MKWRVDCPACRRDGHSLGLRWVRTVACTQTPQTSCDHFSHHALHRCPWCRGAGRVDRLTALLLRIFR